MKRLSFVCLCALLMLSLVMRVETHAQAPSLTLTVVPVYMQVNRPNTGLNHSLEVARVPTGRNSFGYPTYYTPRVAELMRSWENNMTAFWDRVNDSADITYSAIPQVRPRQRGGTISGALRGTLELRGASIPSPSIVTAWHSFGCNVGQNVVCKPADRTPSGAVQSQTTDASYTFTDPETGNVMTVDEYGFITVTNPSGESILEFNLTSNYYGELLVEVTGEDNSLYRESLDGYTLEIEPDGEACTMSDGINDYELEPDEDGNLLYFSPDGEIVAFFQDEDGTLFTEDTEGNFGEFYDGGDYAIYDEQGNILEEDTLENPTLEERSEALGYDLLDDDAGGDDAGGDDAGDDDASGDDAGGDDAGGDDAGGEDASGDDASGDDAGGDDAGGDDAG